MDYIDNADKYARILLKHSSYSNYFEEVLRDTTVDILTLENLFHQISEMKIEPHTIEEEWEDSEKRQEFKDDGYSRDDILYSSMAEALADKKDEILEVIALKLISDYFEGDSYFLNPMVEYIVSKLNEAGTLT